MPLDPEFLIILRRRPRVKPQPSAHCYIKVWASVPEHDGSLSETKLRAAHPRRNPRVFVAMCRIAAAGSSVARLKMRRCSFTSRFASKTIRSLAHFHDAGDEGNALVMIRRKYRRLQVEAIRGPRRKNFRWGKDLRPRKPDGKLSRHGLGARRVALLAPRGVLSKCRIRLIIWVRSPKFWQSSKVSPAFWETANLFRVGEECRRRGGGLLLPCRGTAACLFPRARRSLRASEHDGHFVGYHERPRGRRADRRRAAYGDETARIATREREGARPPHKTRIVFHAEMTFTSLAYSPKTHDTCCKSKRRSYPHLPPRPLCACAASHSQQVVPQEKIRTKY